jgi:hypothetical protein
VPHACFPDTAAMASQQKQMATIESGLYRTMSFGMATISLIR